MYAPIFITVYDRLNHLKECINSLLECPESALTTLYIASDAAALPEHEKGIAAVRSYIVSITGFNKVVPIFREENVGAVANSYAGRDYVFETNSCLIRLEDDVVVGRGFLSFMNEGLMKYKDEMSVVGICGYLPPSISAEDHESFFLKGRAPYGFGIWKEKEEKILAHFDGEYIKEIFTDYQFFKTFEGTHPHVARAIPLITSGDFMPGDIVTAIIMQKFNFLAIYPPKSISVSRGNDGSGLHSGKNQELQNQIASDDVYNIRPNLDLSVDKGMEEKLSIYYRHVGIKIVNYMIYIFYRLHGGYFLYKLSRRLVKKVRKLIG